MDQNMKTNAFYAKEDRREQVKDYFKLIRNTILQRDSDYNSLCDVGCATGDFLWYMLHTDEKNDYHKSYMGFDNFDNLMRIASERLPECEFVKGDIYTGENTEKVKADIVCMSGVLYLFDSFETPLEHLMSMVNEGGSVYIFSTFNSWGVKMEHKFSYDNIEGHFVEFPTCAIGAWCDERNYKYEFIPFELKTEIPITDDPVRTYTIPLADGTLGVVNGFRIWHEFYLLRIEK